MEATFSRLTMTGASAMLLLALVIMWRRHVPAYIGAFRAQSVTLAFVGAIVAWYGDVPELFLVAILILGLKGWLVPRILTGMEARRPGDRELHPLLNAEVSLLVSGALAVVAYEVSRPLASVVTLPTRGGLPIALALILVSLFIVVSRRQTIAQIVGFLMLENGIALLALLGAYGVPLVVELGVFLDVLLGVLVMQILVHRIYETSVGTPDGI
jgi:hydrogenase-4 component E